MRALIAGPRTAVGGLHENEAVFKPSPTAEKLFGLGYAVNSEATVESSDLPAVLLVPVLMSYVRIQRRPVVGVGQSGTTGTPVLGFTSSGEFRRISGVAQVKELSPFNDAAGIHVKASDDSFRQHFI